MNVPILLWNIASCIGRDICPVQKKSVAIGAKVTYLIPPTGKYAEIGKTALVDGLFGGSTFVESWIGWEGTVRCFCYRFG